MNICLLLSARFIVAFAALLLPHIAAAQTPPDTPAPPGAPGPPGAPPAAVPPPAPPALIYKDGVVKVGSTLKQSRGRLTDIDKGDNGCYLTLVDDKKNESIEVGKFDLCLQKPPPKGKKVELTFSMEIIQAADCYGDAKCKRTETVPLVTAVKIVE